MSLPRFFSLLALWLLLSACARSPSDHRTRVDVARVVAGVGDLDLATVSQVEDVVARELADLQPLFDDLEVERFFVHVHAARADLPETLVAGVHGDAPGFALLGRHQIHLVLDVIARTGATMKGVIRHELVHELLDQYCGQDGRYLPRWFHEGLAQTLAGDTYLGASEEDLVWRVSAGSLRSIDVLDRSFPSATTQRRTAYSHSFSYVSWLVREYGLPALLRVARYTDSSTTFARALVAHAERSTLELEDRWRDYLLHGSGARWRSLFSNWFSLLLILALPVLVLALRRRLDSEVRAARRLAQRAAQDRRAAEAREAELRARAGGGDRGLEEEADDAPLR